MQRRWSLLALTLLAFASAYYFYYYDATSVFFTGPAGTLMLMASIFATGFLLSGGFSRRHGCECGRDAHGEYARHSHDSHGHHGHHHDGPTHGSAADAAPQAPSALPPAPKS